MTRHRLWVIVPAAWLIVAAGAIPVAAGQEAAPGSPTGLPSRRTTTVTYEARRTTKIDLAGTPLLPRARGEAEIKTESAGPVRIKADVRDLTPATQFGGEYLTYVFWAIPPQGRAKNLGELRLDDGDGAIEATADVQTFAIIVTAEPYYAVTTPSDVVVMENLVRAETRGSTSLATLQHEIVPRGAYVAAAGGGYSAPPLKKREPPDVQQARNAIAIAKLAGADRFAPSAFSAARRLLAETDQLLTDKESTREIISQARATVQAAEEARLAAVRGRIADEEATARAASEAREQAARAASEAREQAARDAADRETAARAASEAREQAAREAAVQETAARRAAEDDRQRAEEAAQAAAEDKRLAEEARRDAERARTEAQEQTAAAETLRAEAQAQADRADALRVTAEQEQVALRARLLEQFNAVLDTRDTARGLIVNVGDVLFETGRYELRPLAREKLARFAGIVLAHSGLFVQAEGFTDTTGTTALNERLSQQRADTVGAYLLAQGLPGDRVTARGYGAEHPVAANDTREGRQQNRRVELVVTGDVIGAPIRDARR